MRTSWRRTWIKLYPIDCLDGSIRYQLEADERGVWYDLLNFAAICNKPGSIADKDERAYPLTFVANRLNITLELLESTVKKCSEEGRIKVDEQGIHITNWTAYQSEYARQKPYREKQDLEVYTEELRTEYSDLDFDNEFKKYELYWSEGDRELKRPKLALKNWMDQARKFKKEEPKKQGESDPDKFIKGKLGHMVQR